MITYTAEIINESKSRYESYKLQQQLAAKYLLELNIFQLKKEIEIENALLSITIAYKFSFYETLNF